MSNQKGRDFVLINSFGYNIPVVTIPTALLPDVKTKVGSIEDFNTLLHLSEQSGLIRVSCTLGTVAMNGTMLANPYQNKDGIEAFAISAAGEGITFPYIVHAAITLEPDGTYVAISTHTVG